MPKQTTSKKVKPSKGQPPRRLAAMAGYVDVTQRLRNACVGHPHAKIPWPHRVLHDGADEILRLRTALRSILAEASVTWDATKPPADMGKICKLADAALLPHTTEASRGER